MLRYNTIEQPVLIDFGLSCGLHETQFLNINAGTLDYAAVEFFLSNRKEPFGLPQDIWSVACVLWIVWSGKHWPWSETYYSWFKDRKENQLNLEKLNLIKKVDKTPPENKRSILYLLWNMWRIDCKRRWNAHQALEFLKTIQEEDCDPLIFNQYFKTVSTSH